MVDGRRALQLAAGAGDPEARLGARLAEIMGREFAANALTVRAERDGVRLLGFAGLPTASHRTARFQYLFVNRRPVQDRLLKSALRAAYGDLLFHDRQPMAALFLELEPERVDVNVHPAKAEVRFREPGAVRGLVIGALRAGPAGGRRPDLDHAGRGGARRLPAGGRPALGPRPGGQRRPSRAGPRRDRDAVPGAGRRRAARARAARGARRRRRRTRGRRLRAASARRRPGPAARRLHPRPDRPTAWSWSTSTPPTSAWSTSA